MYIPGYLIGFKNQTYQTYLWSNQNGGPIYCWKIWAFHKMVPVNSTLQKKMSIVGFYRIKSHVCPQGGPLLVINGVITPI